ncbi:hypothetical protein SNEBB_004682 [Seison nebaliae]|nr:hypothetical protein SNEBB_004682 [Seison nebaliae]
MDVEIFNEFDARKEWHRQVKKIIDFIRRMKDKDIPQLFQRLYHIMENLGVAFNYDGRGSLIPHDNVESGKVSKYFEDYVRNLGKDDFLMVGQPLVTTQLIEPVQLKMPMGSQHLLNSSTKDELKLQSRLFPLEFRSSEISAMVEFWVDCLRYHSLIDNLNLHNRSGLHLVLAKYEVLETKYLNNNLRKKLAGINVFDVKISKIKKKFGTAENLHSLTLKYENECYHVLYAAFKYLKTFDIIRKFLKDKFYFTHNREKFTYPEIKLKKNKSKQSQPGEKPGPRSLKSESLDANGKAKRNASREQIGNIVNLDSSSESIKQSDKTNSNVIDGSSHLFTGANANAIDDTIKFIPIKKKIVKHPKKKKIFLCHNHTISLEDEDAQIAASDRKFYKKASNVNKNMKNEN